MVLSADMLARSGNLMRVPDPYVIPPDLIAACTAMLVTSGLINNARALLESDDGPNS